MFFLYTTAIVAVMAVKLDDVSLIPAVVPVFAIVELPGLLFIGAFFIACTEFLATPLYAILFIGYWPWGNLFPPQPIPNLRCTPLTAIGRYAAIGLFNQDPDPGRTCGLTQQDISPAAAIGSIVLVCAVAAAAMMVLQGYTHWRAGTSMRSVRKKIMDIEIRGVSETYSGRVHALRDVNLSIPTGMYGLLGPNGAGKTTLMRILAGIYGPTRGEVRVGLHDLGSSVGRQAVKHVLGYLPQDLGVYPDLSATEFLDYVAILKGMSDHKQRRRRIAELLELVSLSDVAARKLSSFSGGMGRRVGIAQALLNDPRLLVVDQPTAGLDPEERIRSATF